MDVTPTADQSLENRLLDREQELAQLQASRVAESERIKPLPSRIAFNAGIALIVVAVLFVVGPIGLLTLSPPDVRNGFLTICGLSRDQLSQGGPTSPVSALAEQLIGIFAIFLPTVVALLGGGLFLAVKSSKDRQAIVAVNEEAMQRIGAIDNRLPDVLRNIEDARQQMAAG